MKKTRIALLAAILLAPATPALAGGHGNNNKQKLAIEARAVVGDFFKSLKGTLMTAMKEGGPVHALGVCRTRALPLTTAAAKKSAWKVGRTSLKLRNPSNKPDGWERAVLKDFETKKAAGADPKKLEFFEIVEADGKKTFRYMKAIPTAKPCLACHGSQIKAPVRAKLADLYPMDKATGFKPGDIRGAFTLSKALP